MSAQLPLLGGSDPALDNDAQVALSIRESRRARQLILQVLPPRTVEVVVPKGMRPDTVQSFVLANREWIRRAGRELVESYPEPDFRPASIELPAIDQSIEVSYAVAADGKARYRLDDDKLELVLAKNDSSDSRTLLRRWFLRHGCSELKPRLLAQARAMGLVPRKVQVRLQRTRWGSCSSSGVISLNAGLLLVAPELMRYLFVHELCHLRHMSHSRNYWALVAQHEPEFRSLDRRLGDCWKHLPAWLAIGGSAAWQ